MFKNIRIILVEPSHPGNIGAVARAMKNMGFSRLYLVNPKIFPCPESIWRAAHADDILEKTIVTTSFKEAICGCHEIIGASARMRVMQKTIFTAEKAAQKIINELPENKEIALIFGRESKGLKNEELKQCQYQLFIPAIEEYNSLNLAQAVQVVVYELYSQYLQLNKKTAYQLGKKSLSVEKPTLDEMESLFAHVHETFLHTGFLNPKNPKSVMPRFRQIIHRSGIDKKDLDLLRGMLSSIQKNKGA